MSYLNNLCFKLLTFSYLIDYFFIHFFNITACLESQNLTFTIFNLDFINLEIEKNYFKKAEPETFNFNSSFFSYYSDERKELIIQSSDFKIKCTFLILFTFAFHVEILRAIIHREYLMQVSPYLLSIVLL